MWKRLGVGISKGSASRKCSKSLHFDFGSLRRDYYTHWIRVLFLGYFKIGLHSIEIFQTRLSFPQFPAFLLSFSKNAGYDSLFSKYLMWLYLCCPQPFNLAYINKIGGSSFPRRWIQHFFWEEGYDAVFVLWAVPPFPGAESSTSERRAEMRSSWCRCVSVSSRSRGHCATSSTAPTRAGRRATYWYI